MGVCLTGAKGTEISKYSHCFTAGKAVIASTLVNFAAFLFQGSLQAAPVFVVQADTGNTSDEIKPQTAEKFSQIGSVLVSCFSGPWESSH